MKSLIAIVTCLSLFALAEKQGRADYRPYRYESNRMLNVVVVTQTGCWYGSRGRSIMRPSATGRFHISRASRAAFPPECRTAKSFKSRSRVCQKSSWIQRIRSFFQQTKCTADSAARDCYAELQSIASAPSIRLAATPLRREIPLYHRVI